MNLIQRLEKVEALTRAFTREGVTKRLHSKEVALAGTIGSLQAIIALAMENPQIQSLVEGKLKELETVGAE